MKSKVIGIQPIAATLARFDGSPIRVGDEIAHEEAVTLTMPAGTRGGSIQLGQGATVIPRVIERHAPALPPVEIDEPTPDPRGTPPALAVSDSAAPARVDTRRGGNPPAVKVSA